MVTEKLWLETYWFIFDERLVIILQVMNRPVCQMSVLIEVFAKRVLVSSVFVCRKEHLTARV